jgi:hypothetical protein
VSVVGVNGSCVKVVKSTHLVQSSDVLVNVVVDSTVSLDFREQSAFLSEQLGVLLLEIKR